MELIRDSSRDRRENPKLVEAIPEAEHFNLLNKVVPNLAKFESTSEFFSAEQHITITLVLSKLTFLSQSLFSLKIKKVAEEDRPVRELAEVKIDF